MTLTQVWGVLLILILCPLLGGLPLIQWLTYGLSRRDLRQLGTGNVSVSAAFYHGGTAIGVLAVLSEAAKGIAAVLLARAFFPPGSVWEIVALLGLVLGRYLVGRGAGTTNVVWGYVVHDWISAALIALIGGVSFTVLRERQSGKLGVLVLMTLITMLRHPDDRPLIVATALLSLLMAWIYQKIPDDLDLPTTSVQPTSRRMFQFFRGDRAVLSLDQPLDAQKVGQKAATLAQLKRAGYPVPPGWVLPPGDDPAPLVHLVDPDADTPWVVRSSAIGEDSEFASAAGQYDSFLNITSRAALEQAILRCQASYTLPNAIRYRQDKEVADGGLAVVVQVQVRGLLSGVAFSRDPIHRQGDDVIIEALPGMATQVVSGQVTPEQYRIALREADLEQRAGDRPPLPSPETEGTVPLKSDLGLMQQVAHLARQLEVDFHGLPVDVEWSYDGQQLWLLQARPITTLLPIWTRKIAAEVIPGFIHPLTWSINRPLTCGVWGEIFTIVLGDRAKGLRFEDTATLHHSAAYFNASLLGDIFRRMGLPPESLEFLTRGAKFSKPPLRSTLQNLPGLLRLARREWRLETDFQHDRQHYLDPGLAALHQQSLTHLEAEELLDRMQVILALLRRATYYSILAPLSAAFRQALFKIPQAELDNSAAPEIASIRALQAIAEQHRPLLQQIERPDRASLWAQLMSLPDGPRLRQAFDRFLSSYGYLSDVATDIAVPTWKEDPRPVQELLVQFLLNPPSPAAEAEQSSRSAKTAVQRRLTLKGQVTAIYSQLLAELRWTVTALETHWIAARHLSTAGDIFFLTLDEIQQRIADEKTWAGTEALLEHRRSQLEQDSQLTPPLLVYGNDPIRQITLDRQGPIESSMQGIGASPGQVEGQIVILLNLRTLPAIDHNTILVVPYTDSGWAPLLAQAGGIIAEVGGQLSHGAIVAREYGIPAVMNVHQATQRLKTGQRVRIDGTQGFVEILS